MYVKSVKDKPPLECIIGEHEWVIVTNFEKKNRWVDYKQCNVCGVIDYRLSQIESIDLRGMIQSLKQKGES